LLGEPDGDEEDDAPTISSEYRTNIVRTMPVEFASKHDCPADVELSWGYSLAGAFDVRAPGKDIVVTGSIHVGPRADLAAVGR
jgi:hypothetical protein